MTDFIKQQQELAYKKGYRHVDDSDTLPEWYSYSREDLDTLITQIIHNTGEELMRLVSELEKEYENDSLAVAAGMEDIKLNALEDIKQHITSVTGAYDTQH